MVHHPRPHRTVPRAATRWLLAVGLLAMSSLATAAEPSSEEVRALVQEVDRRQQNTGDVAAQIYMEQKAEGKPDLVYELMVYRRDGADKLALLFTRPQAEAGKGYLRIEKNLFFYDPSIGSWERRTERQRIGGTNTRRQDFDQSRLDEEYQAAWEGEEQLGAYQAHRIHLEARDGVDVAFPTAKIWVDQASGHLLMRKDYAVSGRLVRTTYYPRWQKLFSESKGDYVYLPEEIRVFDEIDRGEQTTVIVQKVDLSALEDSIFTKAWLETKSR